MKAAFLLFPIALASGAFAVNSSYIPSGISPGCYSFLATLDQDQVLNTCTSSLVAATSAYADSKSVPSSQLSSTLSNLCGDSQCSNPYIRGQLMQLWTSCTDELSGSSPNAQVEELYDILYAFLPLRAAVCTTDPSKNNYCVSNLGSATPASSKRGSLAARDSDPVIDPTAISNSGMPFLFALPSSPSSQLCTPCTKGVMQAYVVWEARSPYALGLTQSPLLHGQYALWQAIQSKCGESFISAITNNAEAAPLAALSGAPPLAKAPVFMTLLGVASLSALMF